MLDFTDIPVVSGIHIPNTSFKRFAKIGFAVEIILPQGTLLFDKETVAFLSKSVWNRNITIELNNTGEAVIKSGKRVITSITVSA
jgi:hypothetical protein